MAHGFCPKCGTEIDEPAAFCPNCGHALREEGAPDEEKKATVAAPRPSVFQTWEDLPSTRAFRKRYKVLLLVFRLLPMLFFLLCIVCIVTLKDIEHNYLALEWCGLLMGAFFFFDLMFDGLHRTRASFLCAHWLKTQKAEPIEELRFFLKAFKSSDANKGIFAKTNLPEESKTAVYYANNPSRKKLGICFTCFNIFFCVVTGIAFGLFLAMEVLSVIQGWNFFNDVTRPPFFIFLGIGAVWLVLTLVTIFYIGGLEKKWYQKTAPDILELMQQLYKKK